MFTVVAYFLVTVFSEVTAIQDEVVKTKSGLIRGIIQPSCVSGKMVEKFLNIPYAEPPSGALRFEKPQPKRPWNGTLNSTENIVACVQPQSPALTITEDCLILNVWTPHPRPSNASVMVWIYGGSFRHGNAGQYMGSTFVAVGDVILVTINYRLSALGFLSTEDDRIKGNLGLFDQRLAMKWVKENIANFGGNNKSITIFGESAGGASVSAHTLSKGSWELFDRAILQSGNMLMPWSIMNSSQIKTTMKWFLEKVNCTNDINLLKCLRSVSETTWKNVANNEDYWNVWSGPVVDGDFFSDSPPKLWEEGKVKSQDVMIGTTKDEAFLTTQDLLKTARNTNVYLKYFEDALKRHFKNSSEAVYKKARELYKPECIPSYLEALKPITAFESDELFICASRQETMLRFKIMNTSNVYQYQYSHAPLVSYSDYLYPYGAFGFAAHGLDVTSVFGFPINDSKFLHEDQTLSMRMILYWTNFAKTGDPNSGTTKLPIVVDNVNSLPLWPRYTDGKEEFLDMESLSKVSVKTKLRGKHCDFLMDPERFVKEVKSGSGASVITKPSWFFTVAICLFRFI